MEEIPFTFINLNPDARHIQKRLGELFMLILGETMVGILFVFYDSGKQRKTYSTCMCAFLLITSVGMQFFERAQSEVDSPRNFFTSEKGETWNHHPLLHKDKRLYALYVALHAVIALCMLIATAGVIEIYYHIEKYNPNKDHDDGGEMSYKYYKGLKNQVGWGLVGVWGVMLVMELLQPEYYYFRKCQFNQIERHSILMIGIKILVVALHIVLIYFTSNNPDNAYMFIILNAVIAIVPFLGDIAHIVRLSVKSMKPCFKESRAVSKSVEITKSSSDVKDN